MHIFRSPKKKLLPLLLLFGGAGIALVVAAVSYNSGFGIKKLFIGSVSLAIMLKGFDLYRSVTFPSHKNIILTSSSLNRRFQVLGMIQAACYLCYSALSFGLTSLIPYAASRQDRPVLAKHLAQSLEFLGTGVQAFIRGETILVYREIWLLAYCLPVVISTAIFLVMLVTLARN